MVQTKNKVFLYIGAGLASDMEYFVAQAPYRLVLIEPNPDLAEYLEEQCAQNSFIRFKPNAIWPDPTQTSLQVFNHFEMSSLEPSDHLSEIFPGIELEKTVTVHTMTPDDLLNHYYHPENTTNVIIDVPGADIKILETMISSEHFSSLGEIYIQSDDLSLFPDSKKINTLCDALEGYGFKKCAHSQTNHVKFAFDPTFAQHAETQRLAKKAQVDSNALSARNKELQQKLDEVRGAQERAEARKEEAERETAELSNKVQALQKRLDMSLQLQSISQSNLMDLQQKYAALQLANSKTEDLLKALYDKLSDVRHFLGDQSRDDDNEMSE